MKKVTLNQWVKGKMTSRFSAKISRDLAFTYFVTVTFFKHNYSIFK